jgi:hypothetical protein
MTTLGQTAFETTVCEIAKTASPPNEILLSPWGQVRSDKGDFLIDGQAAESIIEALARQGVDVPIDWEHHSLGGQYASPDGKALAAGWITSLHARPGLGLFARVTWTPQAVGILSRREYRYISPVLIVRTSDRRALQLHSAALTNKPAIVGMEAVVNKNQITSQNQGRSMYEKLLTKLRELVGLGPESDEAAVLAMLQEEIGQAQSANSAGGVNLTQFVARADHEAVCARAGRAEQELLAMKADAFIAEGQRVGKTTEYGKGMWLRAFIADPEQAREDLDKAPIVAPPSGRTVMPLAGSRLGTRGSPDRRTVINVAQMEHDDEPGLVKIVSKADYISGELKSAGHAPLSEDEAAAITAQT